MNPDMTIPKVELIEAIRNTAKKLKNGSNYQWGHMGSCNCGLLVQELTSLSKAEIHAFAMERYGDWSKQVEEYCPASQLPIDEIIHVMIQAGLTSNDIKNLEKLSDREVLSRLPEAQIPLRYNVRDDVVNYLMAWSGLIEEKIISDISIQNLVNQKTAAFKN